MAEGISTAQGARNNRLVDGGRPVLLRRRAIALILAAGAVLGLVAALIAGGGGDGPKTVAGTPKEAVETVEAFKRALAERDFATVCEELYTTEAREAAGGDDCQSVLAQETAKLRDPEVKIVGLTVRRDGAVVNVQASVSGEKSVADTITLVREKGRFRIQSAGPPVEER
jgi:hypothetical protein